MTTEVSLDRNPAVVSVTATTPVGAEEAVTEATGAEPTNGIFWVKTTLEVEAVTSNTVSAANRAAMAVACVDAVVAPAS